jgi:D-glutamate cyclase
MQGQAPFETLDRLSCVELRSHGLPSGVVSRLYALARRGDPLCFQAARALAAKSVRRTAFFTGIVHEKQPHGELDGPIGCALLATALIRLGHEATVFAPAAVIPVLAAAREACGGRFAVEPDTEAEPAGFDAAVSIERLGRNRKGVHHSIFGLPREQSAVADDFFEALNASGRLTIGIGDGGNEIGFGSIFAAARRVVPRGRACGCPCGDGIVTKTRTQCLLVASVSNFGAYAVTAALALITGSLELAPQPETVVAAMSAALEAGGVDGGSMVPGRVADDGIPAGAVAAVVTLMRATVEMAMLESAHVGVGV